MSDEPTSESPAGGELDRRELLKKAGSVGAGAVAAGALAGTAKAATKRSRATPIQRGGRLIWGLESDPAHVAPFGGILTANHWAKEFAYDSLVEWDRNLNVRPALAEKFEIISKTAIRWTLKRGVRFHNGKEVTAADVKYSVERMLNPPLPGSISTVAQVPAIDRVQVVSKYVFILHLKQPDARVIGFFAWQRYAPIVPEGLYDQINVARERDRHRPVPDARLRAERPGRVRQVREALEEGLPVHGLDAAEDPRRRAGPRRGAAGRGDRRRDALGRRSPGRCANNSDLTVLKGPNAAFRELQMTIKRGEDKPWHDQRVRLAVNHAINRADIIRRVYSGEAEYSGHVPPGYGPWPLTDKELREKYLKFDLPMARKLMADAGPVEGLLGHDDDVRPAGLSADLRGRPVAAEADQHRRRDRRPGGRHLRREQRAGHASTGISPVAACAATSTGTWPSSTRPPRSSTSGTRSTGTSRRGGGSATAGSSSTRPSGVPIYKAAQRELLLNPVQIPLVAIKKYQVVRKRVQNMYVAFSDFNTGLRNVWLDG